MHRPSSIHYSPTAHELDLTSIIGDRKCIVLCDDHTKELCLPLLDLPKHVTIVIPSGERAKSLKSSKKIWNTLITKNASKNTLIVNLGGGVITDLGGFAASLYRRGVAFINIPTTLLGMVDAAIGGKVAVNFEHLKNYIGVFNEAEHIIICPEFLSTLEISEMRSGFAEMLKHGLIADVSHWREISKGPLKNFDVPELDLIKQSIKIKSRIVSDDPEESGTRKMLNFGHTVGHAIEALFARDHKKIRHGDAVAVGMVCEAFLSSVVADLSTHELEEITEVIVSSFGKVIFDPTDFDDLVSFARLDKKSETGELNCTLLNTIGEATVNNKIDGSSLIQALNYYDSL